MPKTRRPLDYRAIAETVAVAGLGGFLFTLASFPAGWLAGAMVFCATGALIGRKMVIPNTVSRAFYIVLGTSMGAVATPATVAGMATWPVSIALVAIGMGFVTLGTVTYLKLVHGWDTQTALFGGIPGGLSQVMALAAEQGSDLRAIAVVQTMRVVVLAVGIPAGLALFGLAGPAKMPVGSVAISDAPWELVILLVLCVTVALVLLRLGFPGGLIFGPMVVSGIMHGSNLIHVTFPQWFASIAMCALGATAGSRFNGTPPRVLLQFLGAAIGSFAVAITITAIFAFVATLFTPHHVSDLVVSYAPGSIDAMMILALALHLDPVFVGAHHLARVFTVTLALPIIIRWTDPPGGRTKSGRPIPVQNDSAED